MAKLSYSSKLSRLNEIVDMMEDEDTNIDDLSTLVKESAKLIKDCQKALREIEGDITKTFDSID